MKGIKGAEAKLQQTLDYFSRVAHGTSVVTDWTMRMCFRGSGGSTEDCVKKWAEGFGLKAEKIGDNWKLTK